MSVNSTQFLAECDFIVIMRDGEIFQTGTYDELVALNSNLLLSSSIFPTKEEACKEETKKEENLEEEDESQDEEEMEAAQKSEKSTPSFAWSFWFYAKTCGLVLIFLHVFFSAAVVPLLGVQSSLFMASWTSAGENNTDSDQESVVNQQWRNFFIYFLLKISSGKYF